LVEQLIGPPPYVGGYGIRALPLVFFQSLISVSSCYFLPF